MSERSGSGGGRSRWTPRRVLLFSGHIIDVPGRSQARFPAALEPAVSARIASELDALSAGPEDLALCGGAAGGDLLFAEACAQRGVGLEILLPFERERFLASSVDPSGLEWRRRFETLAGLGTVVIRTLPADFLGGSDLTPFARNNLWLLQHALEHGAERLRFLALWDGQPGDGAGGTADMVAAAERVTSEIRIIDPAKLR